LTSPPTHGIITCFVIEPKHNWMVTGTNSGHLTLWDLRFHIIVRSWRHPNKQKIHKIQYYGSDKNGTYIMTINGITNDSTVFNIENGNLHVYFRILVNEEIPPLVPSSAYLTNPVVSDYLLEDLQNPPLSKNKVANGMKALCLNKDNYVLTAGDDKKIRFWDLKSTHNSFVMISDSNNATQYIANNIKSDHSSYLVISEIPNTRVESKKIDIQGPPQTSTNHRESITDIKLLVSPHKMLISSSADGVIKIWK